MFERDKPSDKSLGYFRVSPRDKLERKWGEMSHELPHGWTTARIEDVTERVPNIKPEDSPDKQFGYVDISSIDNSSFVIKEMRRFKGKDAPSRARRPIRPNDIVFSNVRTYLRNIALVGPYCGAEVCSTGFTVLRPNAAVEAHYLFRYVLTDEFLNRVTPQQTGTHYPATSDRVVLSEQIPLAPLAEQRRIVAKLEKLLCKVDACQQHLAKIPVLLKRFRQSVLAAACSGRLTADWREENPKVESGAEFLRQVQTERQKLWEQIELQKMVASGRVPADKKWKGRYQAPTLGSATGQNDLPATWAWEKLDAILAYIEAGRSFTCDERPPSENEVGVLKVSAVTWGEFDERESKTCKDERRINPDIQVKVGDFLFSRANTIELVGACVIVKKVSSKLMLSDKTLRLQLVGAQKLYVLCALQGPAGRAEIEGLATGNQNSMRNIGQDRIRDIVIPFPPFSEQQEIVRRVESMFALADKIEARFEKARQQVNHLTSALLTKAFRGELVPQDPNDEPASALLQKIHAHQRS